MIVPDAKDWTWVLQRPCPECGFDSSSCLSEEVAPMVRDNARTWQRLFLEGVVRPGRPNETTWSSLEYACHVRDVCRRFQMRIDLMLSEQDPLFANWDQDATCVEEAYDQQSPEVVISDFVGAANSLASCLEGISGADWERPGRRSNGSTFTVATIARYMIHDLIHHVWDVTRSAA
jgi:hypothetical protein